MSSDITISWGHVGKRLDFTFVDFTVKPFIDRTNLQPITVKVGLTVTLDVNIIGEPPPTVTWFFQDKEIVSDDTIRVDNIDYNSKFFILKTKRAHTGKYVIKAKNEVGEDTADVEIIVIGKPSKPKVRDPV